MKLTAGGSFDPNEEAVYFLAALNHDYFWASPHTHLLVATNDFFADTALWKLDEAMENGAKVFLDSGIFWLTQEHCRAYGTSMDQALSLRPDEIAGFDKLYPRYVELAKRYEDRLWGYTELDQGGATIKRETRAKLEAEGLRPIPVYHPLNDGWDYFDELAEQYDRICVGNIVQASAQIRRRLMLMVWERKRAYPDLWIHVLGYTPGALVTSLPCANSCDSSAWAFTMKFGGPTGPGASSMQNRFSRLDASFSYNLDAEVDDPDGYAQGVRWLGCSAYFQQADWRRQMADQQAMFGSVIPPYVDGEAMPIQEVVV